MLKPYNLYTGTESSYSSIFITLAYSQSLRPQVWLIDDLLKEIGHLERTRLLRRDALHVMCSQNDPTTICTQTRRQWPYRPAGNKWNIFSFQKYIFVDLSIKSTSTSAGLQGLSLVISFRPWWTGQAIQNHFRVRLHNKL